MKAKDFNALTLAQLEAIVSRVENAARAYRDAMSVLGGQGEMTHRLEPPLGGQRAPPQQPQSPNLATPERLERQQELDERRAEQKAYLESQKALRAAKLAQFQHDVEDA